jgi:hypothetical protein
MTADIVETVVQLNLLNDEQPSLVSNGKHCGFYAAGAVAIMWL